MNNNNYPNRTFTNFPSNFQKYNERYEPQEPIIPHFSINNYEKNYPFQTINSQAIPYINSQNRDEYYFNNFNKPNIPIRKSLSVNKKQINLNINIDINHLKNKLYQLEKDNKSFLEENNHLMEEYDILNDKYEKIQFEKEDLLNKNIDLENRLIELDKEFSRLEEDYNLLKENSNFILKENEFLKIKFSKFNSVEYQNKKYADYNKLNKLYNDLKKRMINY